ncbi:MAG TPA: T9SS type A sorting domain-containing protein, partial [Bacteroidales bacterium]|nr:T9SS type A sorting domain-containing protein [Bacteroidales bacterium]
CYHTAPAELIGVAPTGGNTPFTYQWETNASGSWASVPSLGNALNYQPPVLDANTSYRLVQTSASGCGTFTTNTVTIIINDLPVANDLTPTTVKCEDSYGIGTVASVDLTLLNNSLTGGASPRSVTWYRNIGSSLVPDASNETISNGEVFHPRVTNTTTLCYKDAVVTYTVPPKVNISAVSINGVPHQGAELNISYSSAGLCLPVLSTQIEWYRKTLLTDPDPGTIITTKYDDNTYIPVSADKNKYIRAGVKVSDGSPLFPVVYSAWTNITENLVPTVDPGSISISGIKQWTQTLTASYTYFDAEGDAESGSTYKWYKAYAAAGVTPAPGDYAETAGSGQTYVINESDQGYWFKFSVTPKAGTNNTAFGTLAMINSGYGPVNSKPEITSVNISGIEEVGQKLIGTYLYNDADNDPQGTCTFRWLRNGTFIPGATNDYYYVASADLNTIITFEVTPVATTGYPLTGTPATKQTGLIQPLTTDFVNFKDKYCYGEGPTEISVKNVPVSAFNKQFRCTNPSAHLRIVSLDPYTVEVYPTEMTPVRPVGSKTDYLIFSYDDIRSGLRFEISRAFVIDSISTKLSIGNLKDKYCIDALPSAITVDALFPFGGTGTWTDPANLLSDKVVTGTAQGATINPSRGPAGTYPITYKYTSALGCTKELNPVNVTINPLPDPEFYISDTLNVDGGPVTLVPKIPGGVFSGTGVTGSTFLPEVSGTGNYIITHNITDRYGCSNSTFINARVLRAQGTISGIDPKICYDEKTYSVNVSGLPVKAIPTRFTNKNATIVYSPGATTASYNIIAAGPGDDIVKFYYMYGGVEFWLTAPVFIDKLEPAEIRNLASGEKICQNKTEYELFPSVPGGIFTGPVIGNYLYPSRALGATQVSYKYTNVTTGCSATTDVPIYIVKPPQVAFIPADICIESATDSTRFVNNTVSEDPVARWQWIFSEIGAAPDSRKEPAFLYKTGGLHTISLNAQTQIGCSVTASSTIDLGIKPSASFYWKNDCYSPGGTVKLYDASQSATTITRRTWNFNDGELITSDLNPVYHMRDTGIVKVRYVVGISYAGCEDTETRYMYLRPTYSISADGFYSQSFETGPSGWVKDDSILVNNWKFGKPDRAVMNNAASGIKAWFTGYNIANPVREQSSVVSPCFDFSGIQRPMISMQTFKRFERNRNGAALQYKLDGSSKWNYVGSVGDGIDWYNSSVINGSPGGDKIGWTTLNNDPDTAWSESRHKLDELSGKTNIKFRIVYGTDDVSAPGEGFAFDDVWIGERSHNVLLEHFTNAASRDASTANTVVNNAVSKARKDIINIQYHVDFPGNDPLFDLNPGDVSARVLAYGLTKVPYTMIDGGNKSETWAKSIDFRSNTIDTSDIARRSMINPYFSITVTSYVADGILDVNCKIKALNTFTSGNLVLYLAVTEKKNDDYTGAAGETSFYNVFRKFLPDAGGIILKKVWTAGEEWTVPEQSWIIEKIKNDKDIEIIAFIQNDQTKEVFQAASQLNNTAVVGVKDNHLISTEFSVYPNPASNRITVSFGEAVKTNAELSILNVQGQVVKRYEAGSGTTEFTIENPGLKAGIYMLKVSFGGFDTGFKKLIITED